MKMFDVIFPLCRPVRQFMEFWDRIAGLYNNDSNGSLRFGEVDCLLSPKICRKQNITKPLTVKFHGKKDDSFDSKAMYTFFNNKIEKTMETTVLEEATINVLRSTKALVKFYIDSCPHCVDMLPAWTELEQDYKRSHDVSILRINCDQMGQLCADYGIDIYPTVLWIDRGENKAKFIDDRTTEEMKIFIETMRA
jgi:thiol-disulfide isomerase/thioredoxin